MFLEYVKTEIAVPREWPLAVTEALGCHLPATDGKLMEKHNCTLEPSHHFSFLSTKSTTMPAVLCDLTKDERCFFFLHSEEAHEAVISVAQYYRQGFIFSLFRHRRSRMQIVSVLFSH